jgi:hypothetical protein
LAVAGEVVRALHCCIALAAAQVTWTYLLQWTAELRKNPRGVAWRYMLWIWGMAFSQFVSFFPRFVAYLALGTTPIADPSTPDWLRITGLSAELVVFCGVWADVRTSRFEQRALLAACAAAAVFVAVFMSPYPFPPPPDALPEPP